MKCDVCNKRKPKREMRHILISKFGRGQGKNQDYETEKELLVCEDCG